MSKIRLPWMSRRDRQRWRSASTVAELGELMALWLEGDIATRPGYMPNYGPDDETGSLIPSLAALNRAGFVTTCSQPGEAGPGWNGRWWEQRAAVEGVLTEQTLYDRLVAAATQAGLIVRVNDHRPGGAQDEPVVVTTVDGEPYTAFGGKIRSADMAVQWPVINRRLFAEVASGVYLSIAAPEYGAAGQRLWDVMDALTGCISVTPSTSTPTRSTHA